MHSPTNYKSSLHILQKYLKDTVNAPVTLCLAVSIFISSPQVKRFLLHTLASVRSHGIYLHFCFCAFFMFLASSFPSYCVERTFH